MLSLQAMQLLSYPEPSLTFLFKAPLSPSSYWDTFIAPYHNQNLGCLLSYLFSDLSSPPKVKASWSLSPMPRMTPRICETNDYYPWHFTPFQAINFLLILGNLHSNIPFVSKTKSQKLSYKPSFQFPKEPRWFPSQGFCT